MVVAKCGAGETGNKELLFKGWRVLVLQKVKTVLALDGGYGSTTT